MAEKPCNLLKNGGGMSLQGVEHGTIGVPWQSTQTYIAYNLTKAFDNDTDGLITLTFEASGTTLFTATLPINRFKTTPAVVLWYFDNVNWYYYYVRWNSLNKIDIAPNPGNPQVTNYIRIMTYGNVKQ